MCVFFFFHADFFGKKLNFAVILGEAMPFRFKRNGLSPPKTL